jgi:phosphoglycolate phosphatase-like HAD superfamily hydrolase
MADAAVIFDVDGVLLELTHAEEETFFYPFEVLHGLTGLSRDWDSYRIRNDEDIIKEILEKHFERMPDDSEYRAIVAAYVGHVKHGLIKGLLKPKLIPDAKNLLEALALEGIAMGIATANLLDIARLRLEAMELWKFIDAYPSGADGGGHKRDILSRTMAMTGLPPDSIVYVGDNLNDVEAGLHAGVHFIGFSTNKSRLHNLGKAGAAHTAANHAQSLKIIRRVIGG